MAGKSTEPNGAKEAGMAIGQKVPSEHVDREHVLSLLMVVEGTIRELTYQCQINGQAAKSLVLACKFFRQELDKQ